MLLILLISSYSESGSSRMRSLLSLMSSGTAVSVISSRELKPSCLSIVLASCFLGPMCLAGKSTVTGTISSSLEDTELASLASRLEEMGWPRLDLKRTEARSLSAPLRWCILMSLNHTGLWTGAEF